MRLVFIALLLAAAPAGDITFTAQSVNVEQPGTPVKITILRWSTDDETRPIVTALAAPPQQPSDASRGLPAEAARGRAAAAAGRGAAGRGRGRGPAAAPLSPIAAFTAALNRVPTVGYLWTNDITGYSIKYAWHSALPDGTERIVLVSDRRLGAYTIAWKSKTAETDYSFTLIELRTGPKGLIEGKTSLASKVVVDSEAKTVALENYAGASANLAPVRKRQ